MVRPRQRSYPVRVARYSSETSLFLFCSCRYLEATLDGLLARAPSRSQWWEDGRPELMNGARIRSERVWTRLPYDPHFPVLTLSASAVSAEQFCDEAIWHVARFLDELYLTLPYSEREPTLVTLDDHRYHTHLGASVLPSPHASSVLPVLTWEMVLRDLAHSVCADFLLWHVQRTAPRTTVRDLLISSAYTLDFLTAGRRESSTPLPGGSWEAAVLQVVQNASSDLAGRLDQVLGSVSFDTLNSLFEEALSSLPPALGTQEAAKFPSHRETLIGAGSVGIAPLPSDIAKVERQLIDYLGDVTRRRPIEVIANVALNWHAAEHEYEILFEIRAELTEDLNVEPLGFSLLRMAPTNFELQSQQGVCYAHFPHIRARHTEEAIYWSRTRLITWLSLLGVADERSFDYQIGSAYLRGPDLPFPFFAGPIRVPLSRAESLWGKLLTEFQELLRAEDDLATRIRQAVIHLDRAQRAVDSEDRFDEAWSVLEILAIKATKSTVKILARLPLYFVPKGFDQMSTGQKTALLQAVYHRHRTYLESAATFRNKRVSHREVTQTDVRILDHNARWLLSFARTAIHAAVSAWDTGARTPTDIVSTLERIYGKTFHTPLPR